MDIILKWPQKHKEQPSFGIQKLIFSKLKNKLKCVQSKINKTYFFLHDVYTRNITYITNHVIYFLYTLHSTTKIINIILKSCLLVCIHFHVLQYTNFDNCLNIHTHVHIRLNLAICTFFIFLIQQHIPVVYCNTIRYI